LILKPDFMEALVVKGVLLSKLGKSEEAKACAEKLLEIKHESEKFAEHPIEQPRPAEIAPLARNESEKPVEKSIETPKPTQPEPAPPKILPTYFQRDFSAAKKPPE
jgi:hypothetical protein